MKSASTDAAKKLMLNHSAKTSEYTCSLDSKFFSQFNGAIPPTRLVRISATFKVPATKVDVRIKENGYQQIKNSLMGTVLTKDLTNINDLVDNSGSAENATNAFDSGADSEEASGQEEKEVKAAKTGS